MNNKGKYSVGDSEGYEPNSKNTVLKNKLGIIDIEKIEEIETTELNRSHNYFIDHFTTGHKFTADDLCYMHNNWLKDIYEWAGKYRTVNMSKGTFHFAAANLIPKLMIDFEKKVLSKFTPCNNLDINTCAKNIAIVHVEFILIHPFREGNGRISRLLSSIMAMQNGFPALDFYNIEKNSEKGYENYIHAIHAGLDCNYIPMQKIFEEEILKSIGSFNL